MPEDNPQEGVKDVAEASPASESQAATVEAPAESHSVQKEPATSGHVPYVRFKEVNEKMRSYEAELTKLRSERELAKPKEVSSENDSEDEDIMSKYERRLSDEGLDPKASKALSKVMQEIAKDEAKARFSKESAKAEAKRMEDQDRLSRSQKEIAEWQADFRKAHPEDYAKYEEKMQKEWDGLDDQGKMALVASKKSFELLYKAVKGSEVETARAEGQEEGSKSAYETKSLKTALTSSPGSTANPGKKYTAEDVGKMSKADYAANRDKILSDLGLRK